MLSGFIKNGAMYMSNEQSSQFQLLKLKAFVLGELNCYRLHISTQDLLKKINELLKELDGK